MRTIQHCLVLMATLQQVQTWFAVALDIDRSYTRSLENVLPLGYNLSLLDLAMKMELSTTQRKK